MATRRTGTGSRTPPRRSTLGNPYDTGPAHDTSTARTNTTRTRQALLGATIVTGAAMAMAGTAAADTDDPSSVISDFDTAPLPDASADLTATDTPDDAFDIPSDQPAIAQTPAPPFTVDTPITAAADPLSPTTETDLAQQVPLSPFIDPTGTESLIDTVATGRFGSTDTDTTDAVDAFVHPAAPTTTEPVHSAPDPLYPEPPEVQIPPVPGTTGTGATTGEQVAYEDPSGSGSPTDPTTIDRIGITDQAGPPGPAAAALDTLPPPDATPTSVGGPSPSDTGPSTPEVPPGSSSLVANQVPPPDIPAPAGDPLPPWVFDRNITEYRDEGFRMRATGVHEEALRPEPSPSADPDPPRTPEEIAQDERYSHWLDRREAMYPFVEDMSRMLGVPFELNDDLLSEFGFGSEGEGDGLPTSPEGAAPQDGGTVPAQVDAEVPQGATRTAGRLFDLWERHYDRDKYDERSLSLDGVTPEAMNTYLCLAAVRCVGAPPEATVHAGAALADLLAGNGEMSPAGLDEVLAAADRGMVQLDQADRIAAGYLPDARLAVTGDGNDEDAALIRLVDEVAPNETVADLLAARFRRGSQAAGPDGRPRTDPLPGSPDELGVLGVSGKQLRAWAAGRIPPVELAVMEGACQEMARLVCETRYRITGSSAAPNVLASPERQAGLGALNRALSDYWARWQAEPRSTATYAAWVRVEMAARNLDRSIRNPVGRPVTSAGGPVPVPPASPDTVAHLTSQAQLGVLDALHRNLPTHTTPEGTPLTFPEFAAAMVGPDRSQNRDPTFRPTAPRPDHGTGADAPRPGPDTETGTGPSVESEASSTGSGGIVVRPDAPQPRPDLGPNAANDPSRTEPAQTGTRPTPEREYEPERLGGFGSGARPALPRSTAAPRPDTSDLAMPVTRFPRDLHDAPPAPPAQGPPTSGRPAATRPVPSDTAGTRPSPALTTAIATDPTSNTGVGVGPLRRAPLPGGGEGVVVGVQRLVGTGDPRETPGSVVLVQDPTTGVTYASVQPTTRDNGNGTRTVLLPRLDGTTVGSNPGGRTAEVVRLRDGADGRVTAETPVEEVLVRTTGSVVEFNGGGDPLWSIPGSLHRDTDPDDPRNEVLTITAASRLDPRTGERRYTAQVPRGYEDEIDVTRPDPVRISVPVGTPLVTVARTRREFTPAPATTAPTRQPTPPTRTPATIDGTRPSAPTPPATRTPAATSPAARTPATGPPATVPASRPAPAVPTPRPDPVPRPVTARQQPVPPATAPRTAPVHPLQGAVDSFDRFVAGAGTTWNRAVAGARETVRDFVIEVLPFEAFPELTRVRTIGGLGVYDARGNLVSVEQGDPPASVPAWRLRPGPAGGMLPGLAPGGTPIPIPIP